jgi:hypothetical protein
MPIFHKSYAGAAGDGDNAKVQPPDWNADHNHIPFLVWQLNGGAVGKKWFVSEPVMELQTIMDVPPPYGGGQQYRIIGRTKYDLSLFTETCLVVSRSTAAGNIQQPGYIVIQYALTDAKTSDATKWTDLSHRMTFNVANRSTIPYVEQAVGSGSDPWRAIPAGAKTDVFLRAAGGGSKYTGSTYVWFQSMMLYAR